AVRLVGDVDLSLLQGCVGAIAARHDALRTRFPVADGRPAAVVDPVGADPLRGYPVHAPVTDLSGLPPADREPRVRALAQEHYRRPFDLARGPLFRVAFLRLAEREHVALLTMH